MQRKRKSTCFSTDLMLIFRVFFLWFGLVFWGLFVELSRPVRSSAISFMQCIMGQ